MGTYSPLQRGLSALLAAAYLNVALPVVPCLWAASSTSASRPAITLDAAPDDGDAPSPERTKSATPLRKKTGSEKTPEPSAEVRARAALTDEANQKNITLSRIFRDSFVALAPTDAKADRALANAIKTYEKQGQAVGIRALEDFVNKFPESAWTSSVRLNLGQHYFARGYLPKAAEELRIAWLLSKDVPGIKATRVADLAIGERLGLLARMARQEELKAELVEVENRPLLGRAQQLVGGAREGLALMEHDGGVAHKCGPGALMSIWMQQKPKEGIPALLETIRSPLRGFSLVEIRELAKQIGMEFQVARRSAGAPVIAPAVFHWGFGHFGALIKSENGAHQIVDPTFREDFLLDDAALTSEGSGYFLVPAGKLPAGWEKVPDDVGSTIFGRSAVTTTPGDDTKDDDPKKDSDCGTRGMPVVNAHLSICSLNIKDTPVGYAPPVGPAVAFSLVYNQREDTPEPGPDTAGVLTSGLGLKWRHSWLSHIEESAVLNGSYYKFTVKVALPLGGSVDYSPSAPTVRTVPYIHGGYLFSFIPWKRASLKKESLTSYVQTFPDGSRQVYGHRTGVDGAYRFFVTRMEDSQGQGLDFSYDGLNRLSTVTDALGQVTTLEYALTANPADPDPLDTRTYLITSVIDPFVASDGSRRRADFTYLLDGTAPSQVARLTTVKDTLGLQSSFTYGAGSDYQFITGMTTPYGQWYFTTSKQSEVGHKRWLQITDPAGQTERLEYSGAAVNGLVFGPAPSGMLQFGSYNHPVTLHWDRRAYAASNGMGPSPNSVASAKAYRWAITTGAGNKSSSVISIIKPALQRSIFFSYPDQPSGVYTGSLTQASVTGQMFDDGTPTGTQQVWKTLRSITGEVCQTIDPLGREMAYDRTPDGYFLRAIRARIGVTLPNEEFIGDPGTVGSAGGGGGGGAGVQNPQAVQDRLSTLEYVNPAHPLLSKIIDAAGQQTIYTHNSVGQIRTVTNAKGEQTTFWYHPTGQPGSHANASLDPAAIGYLVKIDGPLTGEADSVLFSYDDYGRVRTTTSVEGDTITTDYDVMDRPTVVTYADGSYEQLVYDRLDLSRQRGTDGRWSRFWYNSRRQLYRTLDAANRQTLYTYCGCGALEELTDALGRTTKWEYDVAGRVVAKIYPDGTRQLFTYDANGRLKTVTDARNFTSTYAYNLDNSIAAVVFTDANGSVLSHTPPVAYTYDPHYPRLASVTDGVGSTVYSYHPYQRGTPFAGVGAGQLATVDGPWANDTLAYMYDVLGRATQRTLNGAAHQLDFNYDSLGRLTNLGGSFGNFVYSYEGLSSRLSSLLYPNSQTAEYTYHPAVGTTAGNSQRRLAGIHNSHGSTLLSAHTYAYDSAGRISAWTRQEGANPARIATYAYDDADQLLSAEVPVPGASSGVQSHQYFYDAAGNRTGEQRANATVGATHNTLNQLTGITAVGPLRVQGTLDEPADLTINGRPASVRPDLSFTADVSLAPGTQNLAIAATDGTGNTRQETYQLAVTALGAPRTLTYDLAGNLLADGTGRIYAWDGLNRLIKITQGSDITEFVYNASGQRVIEKLNGAELKRWVWADGAQPIEERDPANNVTKRFFGAGQQIAGVNYFLSTDHLGSVREMTDSSGAVRARYDYDPYGRQTKVSGDLEADFGLTGHYRDQASGLNLTLFRAYDPELGRWLNRDPIGEEGGLNLYAYVMGNPINRIDPLGLDWLDNASNFAAGFGDMISFGLTKKARQAMGYDDVVDKCSGWYSGGEYTAVGVSLVMGGAGAAKGALAMGGRSGGLLTRMGRGVGRFFSDGRTFGSVSRQYWGARGGAGGMQLHHWLIPQRWGQLNAGFNLLELPAGLNAFMNGSGMGNVAEWAIKLGLPAMFGGGLAAGVAHGNDRANDCPCK